ncbi:deleted in malignant brain tumors 1 protein-like [Ruditapes philippinarum]|uniref:deleted in malignant brain tumors 1 protein-like n=1 Tax=Ruditapes philippinarum TaxID=129788 RepID=UPI00295A80D2|nr:deleted in malignant brain tumors 1 protein-like [Ruditapes philippinarum]
MLGFMKICIAAISWICWSHAVNILGNNGSVGFRLSGGTSGTGRLDILLNGQWYPVKASSFRENEAIVACRMLGLYNSGIARIIPNQFGSGADKVFINNFICDGRESSLDKCELHLAWVTTNWTTNRLQADKVALTCEASKIRLVDGDDSQSGRVEIFIYNNWYTVCDSLFDNKDASVICRMLGYTGSGISRAFPGGNYGQGHGGVIVSELECDGSESDIKQCPSKWGTQNNFCDHRRDAGVSCSSMYIFYMYNNSYMTG